MSGHLFWELFQHGRIREARSEARDAHRASGALEREVEALRERLDRVSLACQAMWELLRDQGVLGEERLLDKIEEVDLRDGRRDGKIGTRPVECPACGRMANPRRRMCMYCGTSVRGGEEHVFE